MNSIPILCAAFVLAGVGQVAEAVAVLTYGGACVVGTDTCSIAGTACLAATTGGATTCICDTSKYMVKTSGADTCECATGYTGTVPSCLGIIGGTCTATGGECSGLANAYCNTGVTAPVCACATIYPTGATCTAKSCTGGVTECTGVDANSQCTSNACECKANYGIFTMGTNAKCQPGVGATCTASGGECGNLPGGYCNTGVTAPVCACGAIYTAAAPACATKVCVPGSTTCSGLDANSECGKGYCVCKSGFTIGSSGKCTSSGASTVVMSMFLLAASLLAARMK